MRMQHSIAELRNIARECRQNNQEQTGGILCIWEQSAYCWKNELRDPNCEIALQLTAHLLRPDKSLAFVLTNDCIRFDQHALLQ